MVWSPGPKNLNQSGFCGSVGTEMGQEACGNLSLAVSFSIAKSKNSHKCLLVRRVDAGRASFIGEDHFEEIQNAMCVVLLRCQPSAVVGCLKVILDLPSSLRG